MVVRTDHSDDQDDGFCGNDQYIYFRDAMSIAIFRSQS